MRTEKAFYNIISQLSYEIIAMVCGLILPRFILAAFGSNYNGLISSITQFLDYISILTLGISGATRVAIYKANSNGDIKDVSSVLKATDIYMRKVAYAFLLYVFFLAILFPIGFKNQFGWLNVFLLVVVIGIGVFAEYFFGITFRTYLMANQGMYISNIIQICTKLLSTIISVLLIVSGQSLLTVKFGSAICFAASPIILQYIVRRKYGILSDIEPNMKSLNLRGDVMAHSIANCVHQYTDIFLLTIFTSSSVVSVYSVYGLVLSSLRKLQSVFTSGLEGAFGDLWAKKEFETFESRYVTLEYLMFSFVSVVFSCALILLIPFIKLYTLGISDTEYLLPSFAFISVITDAFFCLRAPYLITVQAAGKYKETKKYAFIEAGLNFFISFFAVLKFGLIGVVFGTLIANIYRTIQYAVYISKNLIQTRPILNFVKRLIWLSLNMVLIYISSLIFPQILILNWIQWILAGVYYVCISVFITVVTSNIFYKNDFLISIMLLRKIFLRKEVVINNE